MFMVDYFNAASNQMGKGIKFQSLVPGQMVPDTQLGHAGSTGYAELLGIPREKFLERFGPPLTPGMVGTEVASILSGEVLDDATHISIKSSGLASLD
jgi:hypothetical protein